MHQIKSSINFVKDNLNFLFLLILPIVFVDLLSSYIFLGMGEITQPEDLREYFFANQNLIFLVIIVGLVVQVSYSGGVFVAMQSLVSGNYISPINCLAEGAKKFFKLLGVSLLSGIAIIIGFLFLILPGIYFLARFALAPCLIMLKNKNIMDSLTESWEMTDEHGGKLFLFTLFFFSVATILVLIVNSYFAQSIFTLLLMAIAEQIILLPLFYLFHSLYISSKT